MDYDVEMLRLYFKEKNYSKEKINELLDSNPFNKEYMEWIKSRNLTGKDLARVIIKNHLINKDTNIQEITSHENDRVSKYLFNKWTRNNEDKRCFKESYWICWCY